MINNCIAIICPENGASESQHGRQSQVSHVWLTEMTLEAWGTIKSEELSRLIEIMPERCQAVINTHGSPTSY